MEKIDEIKNEIYKLGKLLTTEAEIELRKNIKRINIDQLFNLVRTHRDIFVDKDIISEALTKEEVEEPVFRIKILYDPGRKILRGSGLEEYKNMFISRYEKIKPHLKSKMKIKTQDLIATINLSKKDIYNIIGLIYNKKITRESIWIDIEDETGIKRAYVSKKTQPEIYNLLKYIPLDSVIGIKASIFKDLLIIRDIYLPECSDLKNEGEIKDDIYAVFTSDIHVGSEKFLEDDFRMFINILNGKTDDETLQEIIPRIRYLLIAGDLVDGIGIYPKQEKELVILDIREQYKYLYNLLKKLPKYIKIIIIPGNHDASRKALPQPPIIEEYAQEFYSDSRFIMLGNPANISLHGVNIYIYHGDFLQDALTLIPDIRQENIGKAMEILLRIRHVAPTYGASTRIAPESVDRLVIPEQINIFHTGHIHRIVMSSYNDILMINSGTWQDQTEYQKVNGLKPTPCMVPIINLKNRKTFLLNLRS